MALREELAITGVRLFRWRSYLPLVMIAGFLLVMVCCEYPEYSNKFDDIWEAFCLFVSFSGLAVRIVTIGHTPKGTSGRNTKNHVADTLNTKGIYSVVRNPLYLGNFFMGLGIALFTHFWWLALIYILAFWLYYERIIFSEEEYLRDKFGDEFLEWAEVTPVFIPQPWKYQKSDLTFSIRNVLKREYSGFFAVVLVLSLFEAVGEYASHGEFDFSLRWMILLGVSCVVWLTLRILKKQTTLFDVKGR
ncbi:MAG: hypothetical protein JW746_05550 [Candidatus Krumholzibacteriota bacterium]|nr:hypothetical protein [Candidatus Krumholzibacteriota bacterium]